MNNSISSVRLINTMFALLILLNVFFAILSRDFIISLSNALQGTNNYIGFIIIWLIALGFYAFFLIQTKNSPLARYYLFPISTLFGLYLLFVISPWTGYGRGISNVESLFGFLLFYFLSFPALVFICFSNDVENLKALYRNGIFVSSAIVGIYLIIFYWDFYIHLEFLYAVIQFILGNLIYTLLLINVVLVLFTIYKLINQKSKN